MRLRRIEREVENGGSAKIPKITHAVTLVRGMIPVKGSQLKNYGAWSSGRREVRLR
jgi:hypothetical protein